MACTNTAPEGGLNGSAGAPAPAGQEAAGESAVVGGWTAQTLDSEVARDNLVYLRTIMAQSHPELTLGAPLGVWTQVVAGLKVRLTLGYTAAEGRTGTLTAELFHDLEGNVFLNSVDL